MRKILIMILGVVIIFAGCGKEVSNEAVPLDDGEEEHARIKSLDFGENNFNNSEIKSQDDGYYYLRDKVSFTEQYKDIGIQTGFIDAKDSSDQQVVVRMIDDSYNCYHGRDSEGETNGEIGVYNLNTKEYTKLFVVPLGSQVLLNTVNEDYLIWTESFDNSEWHKTRLHLYDMKQRKDIVIYNHSTDSESGGRVYAMNWSNPVIIGNKIYFDDYTGKTDKTIKVDMFCYDTITEKVTKVQNMAKWPTKYTNTVAWNEMGETENECNIYSFDGISKSLIIKINAYGSMSALNTGGEILVFINSLNSDYLKLINKSAFDPGYDPGINCSGLQIYNDGNVLPIIITSAETTYLEWPETNGQIVAFGANGINRKPVFYDAKYDKIVELDLAENGFFYEKHFSEKLLLFIRQEEPDNKNSKLFYYLIKLEDLV